MAHSLTITYPSGTISLNDGTNYRLMEYTPKTGDTKLTTDLITVELLGTASNDIAARLGSINTAFRESMERAGNSQLGKVYLRYQPNGYTSAWQSEIVPYEGAEEAGRVDLDEGAYNTGQWDKYRVKANLTVTRRDWWEGASRSATISNSNGTTASQLKFYNHNDNEGSATDYHINYVSIASNQITGDLPTPALLRIQNYGTSPLGTINIHIFQNVNYQPGTLVHFYELDNLGGSAVAGSVYSGGTCVRSIWDNSSATAVAWGTVLPVDGTALHGQYVNVMVGFGTPPPSDTWMKFREVNSGTVILYESPYTLLGTSNYVQSLGVARFPTTYFTGMGTTYFALIAKRTDGGTLDLDYLQLSPLDGYRKFENCLFLGSDGNNVLIDDPITNDSYYGYYRNVDTNSYKLNSLGDYIYLVPNKDQRLYFLCDSATSGLINSSFNLYGILYCPRKRNL